MDIGLLKPADFPLINQLLLGIYGTGGKTNRRPTFGKSAEDDQGRKKLRNFKSTLKGEEQGCCSSCSFDCSQIQFHNKEGHKKPSWGTLAMLSRFSVRRLWARLLFLRPQRTADSHGVIMCITSCRFVPATWALEPVQLDGRICDWGFRAASLPEKRLRLFQQMQ